MEIKTVGSEKYLVPVANMVCDLDKAKWMKDNGYPQNTYYYYQVYSTGDVSLLSGNRFPEDEYCKHYGAYTMADFAAVRNLK